MMHRPLGTTGLTVSAIGLGGVSFRSLDQAREATAVVHRALERGVTLVDTAPGYGESEAIIGNALAGGERDRVVLSTKYYPYGPGDKVNLSGEALAKSFAESLRRLKTSHVDLLHLHWVHSADDIQAILNSDLGRTMQRFKSTGHIRHFAVSEASEIDGDHAMLRSAIPSKFFSSVMVTYNALFQNAERDVFPLAQAAGTGVVVMMPLNQPTEGGGLLSARHAGVTLQRLRKEGQLPPAGAGTDDVLLDFMTAGTTLTMPQAALRFALDHPAVSSVLVGTANPAHLDESLAAADAPSLSAATHARLRELFGGINKHIK
jgi:aryl-alcohol dehydrogenase-like predicted oxidoreductase